MTKVWLVTEKDYYEGEEVIAVYSTREAAEERAAREDDPEWRWRCITVREWDVDVPTPLGL